MSRDRAKAPYLRQPNDPVKGFVSNGDPQDSVDEIYNDMEEIRNDSLSRSQGGQVDGHVTFAGEVTIPGYGLGMYLAGDGAGTLRWEHIPKGDKGDKGDIGPVPNIAVGPTGTGTANVVQSGTPENPVFTFTLPTAGANGVNTAALQDGSVTRAKLDPAYLDTVGKPLPDPATADPGSILMLTGPAQGQTVPVWSDNLTAALNRIDNNDQRINALVPLVTAIEPRLAQHDLMDAVGTGSPEGKRAAPVGARWTQTDHPVGGLIVWRKTAGTGATGWVVAEGSTGWRRLPLAAAATTKWPNAQLWAERTNQTVNLIFYSGGTVTAEKAELLTVANLPQGLRMKTVTVGSPRGIVGSAMDASSGLPAPHGFYVTGNAVLVACKGTDSTRTLQGSLTGPVDDNPADMWPTTAFGTTT